MCKLRHKVRNSQNLPHGSTNFEHFQLNFSNKCFSFCFRLLKTYSINPSLKNTLGLYVFESLIEEEKINLKFKFELNFES